MNMKAVAVTYFKLLALTLEKKKWSNLNLNKY